MRSDVHGIVKSVTPGGVHFYAGMSTYFNVSSE